MELQGWTDFSHLTPHRCSSVYIHIYIYISSCRGEHNPPRARARSPSLTGVAGSNAGVGCFSDFKLRDASPVHGLHCTSPVMQTCMTASAYMRIRAPPTTTNPHPVRQQMPLSKARQLMQWSRFSAEHEQIDLCVTPAAANVQSE